METPLEVRYTFVFLLAIADPQGFVIGTDVAIARRLNMPLEEFRRCIHALKLPDPNSNSKEHEGRRVIDSDVERGYEIVNYVTYRDLRNAEERRDYMRDYMQRRRAGKQPVNSLSPDVSLSTEAEEGSNKKEVKEEAARALKRFYPPTSEEARSEAVKNGIPASEGDSFINHHQAKGWVIGKSKMKDWKAAMRTWTGNYFRFNPPKVKSFPRLK